MPDQNTPEIGSKRIVSHITRLWDWLRHRPEQTPSKPRVRIIDPETNFPRIDIQANVKATEVYIRNLRDPSRYQPSPYNEGDLVDDRGFEVVQPLQSGYSRAYPFALIAERRYGLPMAMYITGNHARLVLRGPYEGRIKIAGSPSKLIEVYDPMVNGFQEIPITADLNGITANPLALSELSAGIYNISFLNDPELRDYRNALLNGKMAALQKDGWNCIPYCFFVNTMLHGLKPGQTDFKERGINQFIQDFGVGIMPREHLLET